MKKVRSKLHPTEIGVIKTFSLSPDDEIGEIAVECTGCTYYYNNLAELCEGWQDYEEPRWNWYVDWDGEIKQCDSRANALLKFETKEKAEKAVERLRAWERLEDKGFKFVRITERNEGHRVGQYIEFELGWHFSPDSVQIGNDLDLLFGGIE